MNHVGRNPEMVRFPTLRQLGGFRARAIVWIVLVSWLFSLTVCFVNTLAHDHTESRYLESVSHAHADSHPEHDGGTQHEDACCTVLENLSVYSQANNILLPVPAYSWVYVLLPCLVVLQLTFSVSSGIRFSDTGPPGKSSHTFIANSLWPNAPPR
jgi:hypothetical protein